MIPNNFDVYIMTNRWNTVLYIGSTNNLRRRVKEHKRLSRGFTSKYNIIKLVNYEIFENLKDVRKKERQFKNLVRRKKEKLINELNPLWKDLSIK